MEALNPPPVVNLINDPDTPPAVYQDEHIGTFNYTFKFLTPGAPYRVRLHLSDPKDNKPGQRIFQVSINGVLQSVIVPDPTTGLPTQTNKIDIVQQAQSSPGRLLGLVTDSAGNALAGVTVTVTDYTTGATVATSPSPLVTSATPTTTTGSALLSNYSGGIASGTYLVTATPPAGSGLATLSQIVNVVSGSAARADFTLASGSGTLTGVVTDSTGKLPVIGATITLTDSATGAFVATSPATVTTATDGSFTLTAPPGTYDVSVTPPPTSGYAIGTVPSVGIANGTTTALPSPIQLSNSATPAATGTVGGPGDERAPTACPWPARPSSSSTRRASWSPSPTLRAPRLPPPAAPNGDGNPVNYSCSCRSSPARASSSSPRPASRRSRRPSPSSTRLPTATTAANAFVRADKALASNRGHRPEHRRRGRLRHHGALDAPHGHQGFNLAPAGSVFVAFKPVSGDPPIVQAIELISGSNPATSSSFGGTTGTPAAAAPTLVSAIGGSVQPDPTVAATPRVTLTIQNSFTGGDADQLQRLPHARHADDGEYSAAAQPRRHGGQYAVPEQRAVHGHEPVRHGTATVPRTPTSPWATNTSTRSRRCSPRA